MTKEKKMSASPLLLARSLPLSALFFLPSVHRTEERVRWCSRRREKTSGRVFFLACRVLCFALAAIGRQGRKK